MQLLVILGILFAAGAVVFALQNNAPATVVFLLWRFDGSLAIVLLLAVALGAIIVALFSTPATLKAQWIAVRQRREIASLHESNAELKTKIAELERRIADLSSPSSNT